MAIRGRGGRGEAAGPSVSRAGSSPTPSSAAPPLPGGGCAFLAVGYVVFGDGGVDTVNTLLGTRAFTTSRDAEDALQVQHHTCAAKRRATLLMFGERPPSADTPGLTHTSLTERVTDDSTAVLRSLLYLTSVCGAVLFVHNEGAHALSPGLLRGLRMLQAMRRRLHPMLHHLMSEERTASDATLPFSTVLPARLPPPPVLGYVFVSQDAAAVQALEPHLRAICLASRLCVQGIASGEVSQQQQQPPAAAAALPLFSLDASRCVFRLPPPWAGMDTPSAVEDHCIRVARGLWSAAERDGSAHLRTAAVWRHTSTVMAHLVAGFGGFGGGPGEDAPFDPSGLPAVNVLANLRNMLNPLHKLSYRRSIYGRDVALQSAAESLESRRATLWSADSGGAGISSLLRAAAEMVSADHRAALVVGFLESFESYACGCILEEVRDPALEHLGEMWLAHTEEVHRWRVGVEGADCVVVSTCGTRLLSVPLAQRDNPLRCMAFPDATPVVVVPLLPCSARPAPMRVPPEQSLAVVTLPPPALPQLPLDSEMLAYLNGILVQRVKSEGGGGGFASGNVAGFLQRVNSAGRDTFTAGPGSGSGGSFFILLEYECLDSGLRWTLDPAHPLILSPAEVRSAGLPHCDIPLFMASPDQTSAGVRQVSALQRMYIITDMACRLLFTPSFAFFTERSVGNADAAAMSTVCHTDDQDKVVAELVRTGAPTLERGGLVANQFGGVCVPPGGVTCVRLPAVYPGVDLADYCGRSRVGTAYLRHSFLRHMDVF